MEINITKNFNEIFDALSKKNMNITAIAKAMGFTTSAQLHSVSKGDSMLSTKAIISLIQNANINPTYIFLGKGNMFLSDEDEIETLKKENREWIHRHNEAVKVVMNLYKIIQQLQKKNDDLIEITSAALKYHQEKKDKEPQASDEPDVEAILTHFKKMIDINENYPALDEIITKKESLKQEKK